MAIRILAVLLSLAWATPLSAQKPKWPVSDSAARQGGVLYSNHGCMGCHTIGQGRLAGPDLRGVTERRDTVWLKRFLFDPPALLESDSIARDLASEYNGIIMPRFELSAAEIRALIHYLARESARTKSEK